MQITVPVPLVGAHLPTSLNLIFQWILLPEIVTKAPYLAYADDVIFVYIHWQEGTVTYLPRLDPYQLSNYRVVLAIKAGTMEAEGDGGGGGGGGTRESKKFNSTTHRWESRHEINPMLFVLQWYIRWSIKVQGNVRIKIHKRGRTRKISEYYTRRKDNKRYNHQEIRKEYSELLIWQAMRR